MWSSPWMEWLLDGVEAEEICDTPPEALHRCPLCFVGWSGAFIPPLALVLGPQNIKPIHATKTSDIFTDYSIYSSGLLLPQNFCTPSSQPFLLVIPYSIPPSPNPAATTGAHSVWPTRICVILLQIAFYGKHNYTHLAVAQRAQQLLISCSPSPPAHRDASVEIWVWGWMDGWVWVAALHSSPLGGLQLVFGSGV